MTKVVAAAILMFLVVPAQGATTIMAPKVTTTTTNTGVIMTQSPPVPQPGPQSVIAMPPPAITSVTPVECVEKGGSIFLQGLNLKTSSGHSIAIDDGGGTHIDLIINSWSGTSISATVPNDPRVQEGASYWIAMETGHGQWLGNIDKFISVCSKSAAEIQPPKNNLHSATPVGSLLDVALPPLPTVQGGQSAPIKEDVNVEPGEVIVVLANMNEAQQLQQVSQSMGLGIKRRTPLKNLGLVVSVLRVPKGTAVADALSQLRQAMPNTWMDANHRYQLQEGKEARYANQTIAWNPRAGCGAGMHVGLIDTAIDNTHRLFKGRAIMQRSFLATGIVAAPSEHGTAVASILVAGAPTGLIPDVQLYSAAVFRSRNNKEVDTTAESVVNALDWLVGEKVTVINMSLGGSRNLLLEAAVERVMSRGIIVVAAAGNGGDDGAAVYPAAQAGVIAVTAVDVNLKPYKHANHGDYIAYAAPGVDVWVAAPGGGSVYATGTSYAVPYVTAVIAAAKWSGKANTRVALDRLLQSKAKDLGAPGRDNIFGWGLIQMPVNCARTSSTVKRK